MEKDQVPILLVEDNPADLEIITRSLKKGGISNPLHFARDGQEALDVLHNNCVHPGVLILDIHLPKISGMDVLKEIRRMAPEIVVVVVTAQPSLDTAVQALRREGAYDYIQKSKEDLPELVKAIRLALERWAVRLQTRWVVRNGEREYLIDMGKIREEFGLSKREIDVVKCLCRGDTGKEIAEQLFISRLTVKGHVKNIYRKMGVHNRATLLSRILI